MSPAMHEAASPLHVPSESVVRSPFQRAQMSPPAALPPPAAPVDGAAPALPVTGGGAPVPAMARGALGKPGGLVAGFVPTPVVPAPTVGGTTPEPATLPTAV